VTQDPTYSATKAQYRTPQIQGYQKLAKPDIQDAVRRTQVARLNNELLPAALNLLSTVLADPKETTRNRLTAAKIVIDRTIGMGGDAGDDKEPHEMTPAELQARIDRLRREQADRAQPIIEHEPAELEQGGPAELEHLEQGGQGGVFG
jgi:hypothetical protein